MKSPRIALACATVGIILGATVNPLRGTIQENSLNKYSIIELKALPSEIIESRRFRMEMTERAESAALLGIFGYLVGLTIPRSMKRLSAYLQKPDSYLIKELNNHLERDRSALPLFLANVYRRA